MTDQTPIPSAAEIDRILAAHDAEPALPCDGSPIINGLEMRKRLGRKVWGAPEVHGCCGWRVDGLATGSLSRIIVTGDHTSDAAQLGSDVVGNQWIHASISRKHSMPTYGDLKLLHAAVFGDGWAYQVFAPGAAHINIHAYALHLFGRVDGEPALPDFGRFGTI